MEWEIDKYEMRNRQIWSENRQIWRPGEWPMKGCNGKTWAIICWLIIIIHVILIIMIIIYYSLFIMIIVMEIMRDRAAADEGDEGLLWQSWPLSVAPEPVWLLCQHILHQYHHHHHDRHAHYNHHGVCDHHAISGTLPLIGEKVRCCTDKKQINTNSYLYRRQGLVWFDTAVDCEQLSFQLLCRLGAGCSSAMVQWSAGASLWLVQRGWSSVGAEWAPRQLDAGSSESSPAATYLLNFSISGAVQTHISNSLRLWESYCRPVKVPCFWL